MFNLAGWKIHAEKKINIYNTKLSCLVQICIKFCIMLATAIQNSRTELQFKRLLNSIWMPHNLVDNILSAAIGQNVDWGSRISSILNEIWFAPIEDQSRNLLIMSTCMISTESALLSHLKKRLLKYMLLTKILDSYFG